MKTTAVYLAAIFSLVMLFSCDIGQRQGRTEIRPETPSALQDDRIDIKSYKRSADLTEELFQELVDKTPALRKLETDLGTFAPMLNGLHETFNDYDSKSSAYYASANSRATAITDSMLKRRMVALITRSNKQYSTKTTELDALLKQISKNVSTLDDHHTVLKIVLTLPLIEKYQDDNLPSRRGFVDLIGTQKGLIAQTDSLTPNW